MKRSIVALVSTAFLLAGCSGSRDAPTEPAAVTGSIAGFVLDEALKGIVGANVTLDGNRTTTDAQGAFRFANLTAGGYVVTAEAATYLAKQIPVEVVAGNVTDVRIVLPVNTSAVAFHQTFTFKGFVDAHGGSNAPELGECACDFSVPTDSAWQTIIVEAEWEDAVSPVAFETEYAWQVAGATGIVNGTGPSPLLGRVDAGMIETGSSAEIRVAPHSDWIYTSQQFDVIVTVWYGEPAPAGFRVLQPA